MSTNSQIIAAVDDRIVEVLDPYICRKKVRAGEIATIVHNGMTGETTLTIKGLPDYLIRTSSNWSQRFDIAKCNNSMDLGYYVVYEDGYDSWSPTGPFESGYEKDR